MIPIRITDAEPGPAPITKLLIAACVAVFALELAYGGQVDQMIWHWGIVPARLVAYWQQAPWMVWRWAPPLLVAMFLHGGWLHILGNMWFLWVFGPPLERRMGSVSFGILYFAGGILASLVHVWMHPLLATPMIGASGAIAAVLGAFLVLGPLRPVLTLLLVFIFPLILELPAFLVLVLWFVEQLLAGTVSLTHQAGNAAGVAWWAHVGGFVAGSILVRILGTSSWQMPDEEKGELDHESWVALPEDARRPFGFSGPRSWHHIASPPSDAAHRHPSERLVVLRDRWGRPVGHVVLPTPDEKGPRPG